MKDETANQHSELSRYFLSMEKENETAREATSKKLPSEEGGCCNSNNVRCTAVVDDDSDKYYYSSSSPASFCSSITTDSYFNPGEFEELSSYYDENSNEASQPVRQKQDDADASPGAAFKPHQRHQRHRAGLTVEKTLYGYMKEREPNIWAEAKDLLEIIRKEEDDEANTSTATTTTRSTVPFSDQRIRRQEDGEEFMTIDREDNDETMRDQDDQTAAGSDAILSLGHHQTDLNPTEMALEDDDDLGAVTAIG